jgi:hypothetical protein
VEKEGEKERKQCLAFVPSKYLLSTFVHESNARSLSVYLSLSQLAKMLCLSYYCLFILFNGTGEKQRTGSA